MRYYLFLLVFVDALYPLEAATSIYDFDINDCVSIELIHEEFDLLLGDDQDKLREESLKVLNEYVGRQNYKSILARVTLARLSFIDEDFELGLTH